MTNKKLLFFALVFLQTACTENPIKSPAIKKTPPLPVNSSSSKSEPLETIIYKKPEPVKATEEISIPKAVIPHVLESTSSINKVESKPRPVAPSSAAVQSLMADAQKNTSAGDLGSASVMLERALRISPRNAAVTYELAVLRLKQSQPRLAEDLGKKAAFLAADNLPLKKRCWLLILEARQLQGNLQGAKEAQLKIESLE
jgi:predicted Zn-dependent protease